MVAEPGVFGCQGSVESGRATGSTTRVEDGEDWSARICGSVACWPERRAFVSIRDRASATTLSVPLGELSDVIEVSCLSWRMSIGSNVQCVRQGFVVG